METILLCILGLTPTIIFLLGMFVVHVTRQGYNLFEPLTFVFLNVLLGITARSMYIALSSEVTNLILLDAEDDMLFLSQLYACIVSGCFVVGYILGRRQKGRKKEWKFFLRPISETPFVYVILFLVFVISLGGFTLFSQEVGFSAERLADYSSKRSVYLEGVRMNYGYLRWMASLSIPAFLITLMIVIHSKKSLMSPWVLLAAVSCLISVGWAVFTSSRTTLILVGLQAIMATYFLKRQEWKFSLRMFLNVAKWGVPVLVLFLFMGAMRANRDSGAEIRDSISLEEVLHKIVGSGNFFGIAKTSIALKQVPKHVDYLYGQTFLTWFYAPVPRSIWPDKPSIGIGYQFGEEVLGYDMSRLKNGKTISLPIEFYWNFGWLGGMFGMLGYGYFLGRYYMFFRHLLFGRNLSGIAIYISTLYPITMFTMSNSLSVGVVRTLQQWITLVLILLLISRRKASNGRTEQTSFPAVEPVT